MQEATGPGRAGDEPCDAASSPLQAEMRARVIALAFGGDVQRFEEFVDVLRSALPPGTGAVIRGSAVSGFRHEDGAPFDADGPGTSDLDLSLTGDKVRECFTVTGFYVPWVHSIPLSDEHPKVAPPLVPLRERLTGIAGRPVNIQSTRDFVTQLRGDVLGQPYLVLLEHHEPS